MNEYRVVKVKTGEYRIQQRYYYGSKWIFIAPEGEDYYEDKEDAQKWIDRQTIVDGEYEND